MRDLGENGRVSRWLQKSFRARLLAGGGSCLGSYAAIRTLPGETPWPAEWLISAGLFLILSALLPESKGSTRVVRETTTTWPRWADRLLNAFNLVVVASFAAFIVLLATDHASAWMLPAWVGVGLVCALFNHVYNEAHGLGLPSD